jgi:hypothetical protein
MASLSPIEAFALVPDPRKPRGRRHPLTLPLLLQAEDAERMYGVEAISLGEPLLLYRDSAVFLGNVRLLHAAALLLLHSGELRPRPVR